MHKAKNTNRPSTVPCKPQIMVQHFGPIEKAEITLRPLTIFVGESNTGKTYLSTLIFALHRAFGRQRNGTHLEVFTAELKRCFGVASVPELIRLSSNSCDKMKIALRCSGNVFHLYASESEIMSEEEAPAALGFCAEKGQSCAYYLPAGRRGIMQAHEAMATAGQKQILPMADSGILTDFLKPLVGYQEGNGGASPMQRIAAALEAEVLRGVIEREQGWRGTGPRPTEQVPDAVAMGSLEFQYRPRQAVRGLRLSQASSMVSELAPLVLFLRSVVRPGDLLIIEEPEAHLHPAAQSQLAFTFARLVRAGVRVVVTTHSDCFLQQIGNLIREGELAGLGEKVGEPQGFLKKREVGVWLFQKGCPVKEIKYNRVDGIEPPEYLDVAEELYNRAAGLQNRLEETKGGSQFERK